VVPRDAGTNIDEMGKIRLVCRLSRVAYWFGSLASLYHVSLYVLGYAADGRLACCKLLVMICFHAVTVYASVMGRSWAFELKAMRLVCIPAQCLIALYILVANVEWTMHDIAITVVMRPLVTIVAMCVHTMLDGITSTQPQWMLFAGCAAMNFIVVWKVIFTMPSLVGFALSSIVAQLVAGVCLKSTTNALLRERDMLKLVRDGLQQHVDSQDSMWKSVFDATFHCNSMGCISSASAQAMDLFQFESTEALVGQTFSSLTLQQRWLGLKARLAMRTSGVVIRRLYARSKKHAIVPTRNATSIGAAITYMVGRKNSARAC